jgi:hypothetical protein
MAIIVSKRDSSLTLGIYVNGLCALFVRLQWAVMRAMRRGSENTTNVDVMLKKKKVAGED